MRPCRLPTLPVQVTLGGHQFQVGCLDHDGVPQQG